MFKKINVDFVYDEKFVVSYFDFDMTLFEYYDLRKGLERACLVNNHTFEYYELLRR